MKVKILTSLIFCALSCWAQHPGSPGIPSPSAQDFNNAFRNHPGSQSGREYQIRKAQWQARQIRYDAILERGTVPKGEPVMLHVRYQNCEPEDVPKVPEVDGLTIKYKGKGNQSSYSFSSGRGVTSSTLTHQFILISEREGEFVIPPIESIIKGKMHKTKSLKLTVSKGIDYSQYAFINLRNSKKSVYLGEVFPLFLELYDRGARPEEKPIIPSEGFVIAEAGQPNRSQARGYNRITFSYLVRAVKTGDLTLGPATLKVSMIFQNRAYQRGLFDSFFDTIRKEVILNSEPISVKIKPLPDNKPTGFSGAVGNFIMDFSASPTEVVAGDPITLTLRIEGRGALEILKMPSLKSWKDFKQYEETSSISYSDELGLSGTKTFEKVIIPNHSEIRELPEFAFHFFDPLEETYKSIRQPATPIIVKPNMRANNDSIMKKAQPPLNFTNDLLHIKPRLGKLESQNEDWLSQTWFICLHVLPIIVWMMGFALGFLQAAKARNPRAKRRKAVQTMMSQGLLQLEKFALTNQSDEFFALLFRLLQEQIGERLDMSAAAITEAAIEGELKDRLSNPESLKNLERLFHICNQSRYAPADSTEELSRLAQDASALIEELQSMPDPQ